LKRWRKAIWVVALLAVAAVTATLVKGSPVLPDARVAVPTAKVIRGPLKLTVYATGELRAGRTVNLVAPPAGGALRILKLIPTGTPVKKDEVVIEFDPSDQQYNLEQARSDLAEAEQSIVKMRADNSVQASQDKLNLLTARYDVRRAELAAAANEFVGAIESQKNELTLEEARQHLSQLERDSAARVSTGSAALAVAASVGLQTAYHLYQGAPNALAAGAGFLLYACFYARFRRILPVILAHACWDLLVVLHRATP